MSIIRNDTSKSMDEVYEDKKLQPEASQKESKMSPEVAAFLTKIITIIPMITTTGPTVGTIRSLSKTNTVDKSNIISKDI